jgi:RNA polymerase sigma-70 factor (ECF subfamily)
VEVTVDGFEELVRPCVEPGFRLARVMLGNHADAEDAVQEAATRAWRKIDQLRGPDAFRPWFLAIVANQCRAARRTAWWSVLRLPELPARPEEVPGDSDDVAGRLDLRGALGRLSADDRAALLLFYGLDMALEDVAGALRVSPGAAKSRIHRAAARLRTVMAEEVPR